MVEQLNTLARLWWDWSAAMFWQVGLLIVLIACLDRLVRRWAWPQLRYALWSLVLIKLLLPPSLSLPSGIVPGLQPKVAQAVRWMDSEKTVAAQDSAAISDFGLQIADFNLDVDAPFVTAASRSQAAPNVQPAVLVTASPHDANPQFAIVNPQLRWPVYAMAIWLAGTVILGTWLFIRLHSLAGRHAYTAAVASLPQSFYNQLAGCAKRLKLRHVPRVAVTGRLASPAVFGVFRPVLLMPKGYLSKLSRRDTEHMLLHELAHIRRGDLVMHGLYMLVQIVYWYNPLLWLVRRQLHHLRELSCDATVANLLRERTPAYRQTLLETARRLLAGSVEPGLGLLGLFEDSNRLAVRLNWLTKPTWRYRTMKRITAITVAALMLACVLPMAQAQGPASDEVEPVRSEENSQLSQDIAALELRLQELMAQQQELQKQLQALAEKRSQVQTKPVKSKPEKVPVAVTPHQRTEGGELGVATVAPAKAPAPAHAPEHEHEAAVKRAKALAAIAEVKAKQAAKDAEKAHKAAKAQAETGHAEIHDLEQWAAQIEAWAAQVEQWEQSEEMQKWQADMEKWGEQIGHWGQELARRQTGTADASAESADMPEMAPMPEMPAMPSLPAPTPIPMPAPAVSIHVPEVHVPHIEPPHVEPPVLPAAPKNQADLEEGESHGEYVIKTLTPDKLLEVTNDVGSITVRGVAEPTCRIVATVKSKAATAERAREIAEDVQVIVTTLPDSGRVTVRRPDGLSKQERDNYVVALEVLVPHEAQIKASQNMGDIRLTGLNGSTEAHTNMGDIRTTEVSGRVLLSSNMGDLDYLVPANLSAKIQAATSMGSIKSDLPLEGAKSRGLSMGGKVSGTVGQGEGSISLTTNMGSIRIRTKATGSDIVL